MQQTGSPTQVDIGGWISAGWNMFTAHWGTWVKMSLIVMIPIFPGLIGYIVGYATMISSLMPQPGAYGQYGAPAPEPPVAALGILGASVVFLMVGSFVSMYFSIGMWKAAIKQARGGVPSLGDLKGNGHLYLKMLGASILVGLCGMLGLFACYIGVFVVMGWFLFVAPLIVDKDLGVSEAMSRSKAASAGQLLMIILYAFLVGLLSQVGAYVCLVGVLATLPLHYTMHATAYVRMFDGPAAAPAVPAAPFSPPAAGGWAPPPT